MKGPVALGDGISPVLVKRNTNTAHALASRVIDNTNPLDRRVAGYDAS